MEKQGNDQLLDGNQFEIDEEYLSSSQESSSQDSLNEIQNIQNEKFIEYIEKQEPSLQPSSAYNPEQLGSHFYKSIYQPPLLSREDQHFEQKVPKRENEQPLIYAQITFSCPTISRVLQYNNCFEIDHKTASQEQLDRIDLVWTQHIMTSQQNELFADNNQKVSQFLRCEQLTFKNLLTQHLNDMKEQFPSDYNFYPLSFDLSQDYDQLTHKVKEYKKIKAWIVKPGRGRMGEEQILKEYKNKSREELVLSQYISRPLLINKLKCDLRLYIVIPSIDPLMIMIYPEGLVRFATEEYNQDLSNIYAHLTNYSLNKHHNSFIENTQPAIDYTGSKQSYTSFIKLLNYEGKNTTKIQARIDRLIVKSVYSSLDYMSNVNRGRNAFQMFGFDILLDDKCKPWLLEINLSPSLASTSPLDNQIKTQLVTDTLHMIGLQPQVQRKAGATPFQTDHRIKQWQLDRGGKAAQIVTIYETLRARKRAFRQLYPVDGYHRIVKATRQKDKVLLDWIHYKKNTQNKNSYNS